MAGLSVRHSQRQGARFARLERKPNRRTAEGCFPRLTICHEWVKTSFQAGQAMLMRLFAALLPRWGRRRYLRIRRFFRCSSGKSNARSKYTGNHDRHSSHDRFPYRLYIVVSSPFATYSLAVVSTNLPASSRRSVRVRPLRWSPNACANDHCGISSRWRHSSSPHFIFANCNWQTTKQQKDKTPP
jgi:hypothetical protein